MSLTGPANDLKWWYPVAAEAALGDEPTALSLMGVPLVLWRDAAGTPVVLDDRCPHRGARLSLGRVCAGEIECPYHGWRFDHRGRCVAVPSLPTFVPPPGHRVRSWQARAAHGLWWVADVAAPDTAPFAPAAIEGLPPRQVVCGPYEVAAGAGRVVENFLDTAHFGFVHGGSLGERGHSAVPDYRVEHDGHGRPGVPAYRAWQPRASSAAAGGAWVDYRYQVLGPTSALLTKKADGVSPQEAYALWVAPTGEEHCRVWFTLFTTDTVRSDDDLRAFQDMIFRQDQPVLESQRPKRLPPPDQELHGAADRLSITYRRWLMAGGLGWALHPE